MVYTAVAGANGSSAVAPFVDVAIVDQDAAGVLVRETHSSTDVIEPTDLVLLGSGQVTNKIEDGTVIQVAVATGSPPLSGSGRWLNQGDTATQLRLTVSGNNSSKLYVALSGAVSSDDGITLKLKPARRQRNHGAL